MLLRVALLEIRGTSFWSRTVRFGGEAAVEDPDDFLGHMNRVARSGLR